VRQARWLVDYARNVRSWGRLAIDACAPVDIWHAHDLPSLVAIAPAISSGVPVIYDSHEIFVDAGAAGRLPGAAKVFLRGYERHLVARVAAVVTVNESLARLLQHRYRPKRLVVVYNAPPRWDAPAVRPDHIRQALGLERDVRIVLYHGSFSADRGLAPLAEAMLVPGLEHAHLAYVGFGPMTDELVALSREPRFGGRIHVLPAVSPEELSEWVASADVGVMPNQPTSANERLSTPNKLFENLATGIPVVTSDYPERRRIVVDDPDGPLGETCDPTDSTSIGEAIRRIVDLDPTAYADLRRRCLKAAHERWNWETEAEKLLALYPDVLGITTPVGPPRRSAALSGSARIAHDRRQ
jgi:glycosyltransferase involved in cell wall biosynthesis